MGLGVGLDDRDRKYSRYYGGQVFFSRKLTKQNKLKQYPEDIKLGENDFRLFVQKKKEPQNPNARRGCQEIFKWVKLLRAIPACNVYIKIKKN